MSIVRAWLLLGAAVAMPITAQDLGHPTPAENVTCAVPPSSTIDARLVELDGDRSMERVASVGRALLRRQDFASMNHWLADCIALTSRNLDGRFTAEAIVPTFRQWWGFPDRNTVTEAMDAIALWREATPDSSNPVLFEAIYWYGQAWANRGDGAADAVPPAALKRFRDWIAKARGLLEGIRAEERSPPWYELAVSIALESGAPTLETLALYREGARRYPEYHPIHFAMARAVFPQWGGSDAAVEAFAQQVRQQAGGALGDEFYARIYWTFGWSTLHRGNFFEFSRVSWPTMRRGFQEMERRNPESAWTLNNFAAFACRANDAATYLRLQPKRAALHDTPDAWPDGWSREVCDGRFTSRT